MGPRHSKPRPAAAPPRLQGKPGQRRALLSAAQILGELAKGKVTVRETRGVPACPHGTRRARGGGWAALKLARRREGGPSLFWAPSRRAERRCPLHGRRLLKQQVRKCVFLKLELLVPGGFYGRRNTALQARPRLAYQTEDMKTGSSDNPQALYTHQPCYVGDITNVFFVCNLFY